MRLAHLSDIHLFALEGAPPWRFLNKRITGGLNLLMGRSGRHQNHVLEKALDTIEALGCDHVALTGDVTNLALGQEFSAVAELLRQRIGGRERLTLIPGNHDRYTTGSQLTGRFERHFKTYLRSDLPAIRGRGAWPVVRLFDNVAIIAMNSAVALPPLVSGGVIGMRQRRALRKALAHPDVRARYRVVMLHHHLFSPPHATHDYPRRLFDRGAVRKELARGQAQLVLHGHNHFYGHYTIPWSKGAGEALICEAGSGSVIEGKHGEAFGGKFNVYDIRDGVLQGFDTYLYRDPEGFVLWKRWQVEAKGGLRELNTAEEVA